MRMSEISGQVNASGLTAPTLVYRELQDQPRLRRPTLQPPVPEPSGRAAHRCSSPVHHKSPRAQHRCERGVSKRLTHSGAVSTAAKLDILIDAFHLLIVGSPYLSFLLFMNSYALLASETDPRSDPSAPSSSSKEERNPKDKRWLRPLLGVKSLCGRIWKVPPDASTVYPETILVKDEFCAKIMHICGPMEEGKGGRTVFLTN